MVTNISPAQSFAQSSALEFWNEYTKIRTGFFNRILGELLIDDQLAVEVSLRSTGERTLHIPAEILLTAHSKAHDKRYLVFDCTRSISIPVFSEVCKNTAVIYRKFKSISDHFNLWYQNIVHDHIRNDHIRSIDSLVENFPVESISHSGSMQIFHSGSMQIFHKINHWIGEVANSINANSSKFSNYSPLLLDVENQIGYSSEVIRIRPIIDNIQIGSCILLFLKDFKQKNTPKMYEYTRVLMSRLANASAAHFAQKAIKNSRTPRPEFATLTKIYPVLPEQFIEKNSFL